MLVNAATHTTMVDQFETIVANAKICAMSNGGAVAGPVKRKRTHITHTHTPTVVWFPTSAELLGEKEFELETCPDICLQACLEERADLMAALAAGRWSSSVFTALHGCEQALKRMGVDVDVDVRDVDVDVSALPLIA